MARSERSLLRQSGADAARLQRDGWGIGWYERGRVKLVKSPRPVYEEKRKFAAVAGSAVSRAAIAHTRWMSNPLGLPREKLLSEANTQPFSWGNIIFAHNGALNIPLEIRARLGRYAGMPRGDNDSEAMFWHFIKHLSGTGDFRRAIENSLREIWRIWRAMPAKTRPAAPYKGMNIFASDGKTLFALRRSNSDKEALCSPGWNYGAIAWRLEKGRLIAASEPLDGGHWNMLEDRQLLAATPGRTQPDVQISHIGDNL